jgi:hypothetical protein
MFGDFPFAGKNQYDLLQNMDKKLVNFNVKGVQISDDLKDLIRRMLIPNPQERIDWVNVYDHRVLNPIPKNEPKLKKLASKMMNKKELIIEYENLVFSKNKEFYMEQSKIILKPMIGEMKSETKNSKVEERKNSEKEEAKKNDSNSEVFSEEESKINNNNNGSQKRTPFTLKGLEMNKAQSQYFDDEENMKKINDEKLSSSQDNNQSIYSDSYLKKKRGQSSDFPIKNQEELQTVLLKVESKNKDFSKLESKYLHAQNVIAFHAKVLVENNDFGEKDDDNFILLGLKLVLMKKIMMMAKELMEILEKKRNIFLKNNDKLFKDFVETRGYKRLVETFNEQVGQYEIHFMNSITDFEFLTEENPFYEKIKCVLYENTEFDDLEELLKEILFHLAYNNKDLMEQRVANFMKMFDLCDYRMAFLYHNEKDDFDFDEYERKLESKDEIELRGNFYDKIENLMQEEEIIAD